MPPSTGPGEAETVATDSIKDTDHAAVKQITEDTKRLSIDDDTKGIDLLPSEQKPEVEDKILNVKVTEKVVIIEEEKVEEVKKDLPMDPKPTDAEETVTEMIGSKEKESSPPASKKRPHDEITNIVGSKKEEGPGAGQRDSTENQTKISPDSKRLKIEESSPKIGSNLMKVPEPAD